MIKFNTMTKKYCCFFEILIGIFFFSKEYLYSLFLVILFCFVFFYSNDVDKRMQNTAFLLLVMLVI